MPYVTEEIYLMLPIHDESIMISSYPVENKDFDFTTDLDYIIDIIKNVRKIKQEKQIGKDFYLVYSSDSITSNLDILKKMLKLENIVKDSEFKNNDFASVNFNVKTDVFSIYYEKVNSKEELEKLELEKTKLESSIERRKKLLDNPNYVNKAPVNIVEAERKNLEKEEVELKLLLEKISNL